MPTDYLLTDYYVTDFFYLFCYLCLILVFPAGSKNVLSLARKWIDSFQSHLVLLLLVTLDIINRLKVFVDVIRDFPLPSSLPVRTTKNKQDGGLVHGFPLWGAGLLLWSLVVIQLSRYSIGCQRAAQQLIGQKRLSSCVRPASAQRIAHRNRTNSKLYVNKHVCLHV